MIKKLQHNRQIVFSVIIGFTLSSFMISYALNSICMLLLLLFFFVDSRANISRKFKKLKTNRIVLFYILLFLAQVIGLFYSSNMTFGMRRVEVMLPILFLPAIIFSERIERNSLFRSLNTFKYILAITFLTFILKHVFIDQLELSTFVLFVLKEFLGISQFYIAFVVIIAMLLCFYEIQIKVHLELNIILLLFFIFCLLLLGNKTSIIALSIVFFGKFFNSIKYKTTRGKIVSSLIIPLIVFLIVLLSPGLKKRFEIIAKTSDFKIETVITKNKVTHTKNTLEHRYLINYIALTEIRNNLPFGVGTGDFIDIMINNYRNINFKVAYANKFNNHNQYLSEFLKTGILGGFCFLILTFLLLKKALSRDKFYAYIIIFFAIACCFESYLFRQHGVVIFTLIIPLFLRLEQILNCKLE